MNQLVQNLKAWIAILITIAVTACGSGDEYEGFDATVSISTPNKFLTFFNRQGDLAAGDYTLVVATAAGGQAGTFSVTITRNDGSATQVINGSWVSSGGLDSDPTCASGNRCYNINLQDASGASFTLNTAFDGVLYLVDDSDTPQVVATANAAGTGAAETLKFSESEIDETDFASAYYAAIDPMGMRTTAQDYIALHGLGNPDVHVIFRDSKDLGYGRDMYMRSYANPSACGGQIIAFLVRNFAVEIVDGFAYGPVNLEAAIDQDLQHNFGSNAIEFGLGRADVGDPCSSEPMAKFYTFRADYSSPGAVHPRLNRIDLDARGAKAMPQHCVSCHGGKLRPLDRFGRFVPVHANDAEVDIGNTKARLQAFEVATFEFSEKVGHRRVDYEEDLRLLNSAIYCSYPGSAGHPACIGHGGGVTAQMDLGEWSGDFAREMMLGWYGNALDTPGSVFDYSFVPPGWTPSIGGPPVGADALFTKVIGPNCFVCHGKQGTEKGSNNNALGDGKDLDFRTWDKFISHADEIERLVFDEGKMPLGLVNYQNFWGDPEKAELLASFIAPHVTDPGGFQTRRIDGNGNIILPGRVVARAGPDRVTQQNAAITLNAEASLFASSFTWSVIGSPMGSVFNLSNPTGTRTDFSADTDGDYNIRLTASSSEGGSGSDTITVVVNNALLYAPRDLVFYPRIGFPNIDIKNRLDTCASTCHSSGVELGIPVWFVDDGMQPLGGIPATTAKPPMLGLYEQVRARVNLELIEDSLILKKPSGVHHFGDSPAGFNMALGVGAPGRADYDRFVNWIAEGAACGGNATECVQ